MTKIRSLLLLCIFLISVSVQAQSIKSKVGLHTTYMPKFKVQQASDRNVRAVGLRWMVSDYNGLPYEFGFHFFIGYGHVASGSIGVNLAYIFGEPNTTNFKLGLSLGRIDMNDVDADKKGSGPQVGDVNFLSGGTQFKPYVEFE